MFPLQIVVFPGEEVNLHIFEPRYRQLLRDCEREGLSFGIPPVIEKSLMDTGTEVELVEVAKRYPGGELDIRTRGGSLFKIESFHEVFPGKLYAGADVQALVFREEGDPRASAEICALAEVLFSLLKVEVSLPDPPDTLRTFDIGHKVGLSLEQEYELLCQPGEPARQKYMLNHLKKMIPIVKEMERVKEKVKMNGHFRNIKPPRLG